MSTSKEFIDYILENIEDAGVVTVRKMFGEYAVYCDGKVIALVCDNQFFLKPTEKGRKFIGDVVEAPPYKGAKDYFLIEDGIDDRKWFSKLIQITAAEVPEPKPKKKKAK
ncbi:MAG TPA: TfoX/Sxy family protein [bacterium]|nr:TfoX/Sxy family protein [bacterium]